jgi:hypothetical protein
MVPSSLDAKIAGWPVTWLAFFGGSSPNLQVKKVPIAVAQA